MGTADARRFTKMGREGTEELSAFSHQRSGRRRWWRGSRCAIGARRRSEEWALCSRNKCPPFPFVNSSHVANQRMAHPRRSKKSTGVEIEPRPSPNPSLGGRGVKMADIRRGEDSVIRGLGIAPRWRLGLGFNSRTVQGTNLTPMRVRGGDAMPVPSSGKLRQAGRGLRRKRAGT